MTAHTTHVGVEGTEDVISGRCKEGEQRTAEAGD